MILLRLSGSEYFFFNKYSVEVFEDKNYKIVHLKSITYKKLIWDFCMILLSWSLILLRLSGSEYFFIKYSVEVFEAKS